MALRIYLRKLVCLLGSVFILSCLYVSKTVLAETTPKMPTVVEPGYRIQSLMPKTEVNGFNGAGVYKIDKETGAISAFILPPPGRCGRPGFRTGRKGYMDRVLFGKSLRA